MTLKVRSHLTNPLRMGTVTAALVASLAVGAASAQAHIVRPPANIPGAIPTAIVTGTFGGGPNGCKDIAVASSTSGGGTVRILEGVPPCQGDFNQIASYPVGPTPTSIILAQLDAGSVPDLAVTTADSDQVWVLFGNSGLATFTPRAAGPIPLPAGSHPRAVVAGNWNTAGLNELAVANGNANTVTILDSFPGFGVAQTIPIPFSGGAQPNGLAVGDFNGNGDPDLAVSSYTAGTVTVLSGGPGSTFNLGGSFAAGAQPVGITAAKFDSDSLVDIVVGNSNSSSPAVRFLKGDGMGGFSAPVASVAATPGYQIRSVGTAQLGLGSMALDLAVVVRSTTYPFDSYVRELAGGAGLGTGVFTFSHSTPVGTNGGPIAVDQLIASGAADFAVGASSVVAILEG